VRLSAGALHQMAETVPHLEIDAARMQENLGLTQGLIFAEAVTMALSEKMGRSAAHQVVEAACGRAQKENRHLREVLAGDAQVGTYLSSSEIDGLFDPRKYLGAAEAFVDRVVEASRSRSAR
jgi:3-carboxy-cis,cis-muconate cycloisomerase